MITGEAKCQTCGLQFAVYEDCGGPFCSYSCEKTHAELARLRGALEAIAKGALNALAERLRVARDALDVDVDTDSLLAATFEMYLPELQRLRDWKAGATGASVIAHPPRSGPHTEAAYAAHKDNYLNGSEDYREGADIVSAALLAAAKRARKGR